jgi:tRNA (guanine37-N1)-methyltransferase
MKFLKVLKSEGEAVRRELAENGLIATEYPILQDGQYILIPVTSPWGDYELVERDAEKRPEKLQSIKDALMPILSDDELEQLTTSFDIIGDIAIVEVPDALEQKENEIGQALLKVHGNLKTVLKKLSAMEGEYRVRRLSCIAGEDRTETVYREHGVSMKLDLAKVYFSVRLSTERKRISELVSPGEKVLVLFAGVGPFAFVIAKDHPDARVTAVEINPEAVRFMRENIELNRFSNIEVLGGDARNFQYDDYDRIVMPLPHSAEQFLDLAHNAVKPGGTIHFYSIVESDNPFENAEKKIPFKHEISGKRIVRPYSPNMVQVVLDLVKSGQESD